MYLLMQAQHWFIYGKGFAKWVHIYYGELLLHLLFKHVIPICMTQIEKSTFESITWVQFLLFLSYMSDDTGNRLRFQLELEFVQCLANPNYLNCKYLNVRILRN